MALCAVSLVIKNKDNHANLHSRCSQKWEGCSKSIIIIGGGACNEKLQGWTFLMLSTPSN